MKSEPLVAVGIPAYNRPDGLRKTLNTLCNQSYKNLVVFVSNDSSPDPGVEEVIQDFCRRDKRVIGYSTPENLGIIGNHRFLLSKIPEDIPFLVWACDDDDWHPDYVKVCMEAFEAHPDAILCTTDNLWVRNGLRSEMPHTEDIETIGVRDPVDRFKKVLSGIVWWNHAFYGVIRRSAYSRIQLRNVFAFDIVFIAQLSLLGQFVKIEKPYFVKTLGGYGSALSLNLHSVKDNRKLSRYLPRLAVLLDLQKAIRNDFQFSKVQKRQLLTATCYAVVQKSTYGRSAVDYLRAAVRKSINAVKFGWVWLQIRDFRSAWQIHIHRLPARDFNFSGSKGKIYAKKLSSLFEPHSDIFQNYAEFLELLEVCQADFSYDASRDRNLMSVDGISFELRERFYGFMLYEVFAREVYRLDLDSSAIVIDVGASVGISALYFARQEQVRHVFSFEPFPEAAHAAQDNIELNPLLKPKIHLEHFGLSDQNQELTLNHSFETSHLAGIKEDKHHLTDSNSAHSVTIQVKKATQVLTPILKVHEKEKRVLKIKTEGSEYQILGDMSRSSLLEQFDIVMIEWHGNKFYELIDLLERSHFQTVVKHQDYSPAFSYTGMIYASRILAV